MILRSSVIAALALVGSACAHRDGPPSVRIDVPELPSSWTADGWSETIESGGTVSWGEILAAPELDELVVEALHNSPSIEVVAARLEQAIARSVIAGAERYPQIGASLDGGRRKQNFIGLPFPREDGQVVSVTTTTWGVALNVSWEADLWGRIRAGHRAARADAAAVALDLEAARLSLAAQTAKAWAAVIEASQQVALASETHQNRLATVERIDRRYRSGLAPSVDLRLARTNAAIAEASLAGRRRQLDAAKRQLEILLGRYPAAAIESRDSLPTLPEQIRAGLPADLIARRPDLRATERRMVASRSRVEQAEAALYPQIRLTGSTGSSSDELENLLDGDFSVWSFALGILQPIFQGGRLRANVALHEAIEDEVAATFIEQALRAFAEVELAIVTEGSLADQEDALARAAASASAAQQTVEERYGAGLTDYLLVLESQRQALDAQSRLLEVRRSRFGALIDLCLALGGELPVHSADVENEE